jgi:hypothetical protein
MFEGEKMRRKRKLSYRVYCMEVDRYDNKWTDKEPEKWHSLSNMQCFKTFRRAVRFANSLCIRFPQIKTIEIGRAYLTGKLKGKERIYILRNRT